MILTNILIGVFASVSYFLGFSAIIKKQYKPNLFSRFVWLGLALNNVISVIVLNNQLATVVLASITLFGSLLIFLGSIFLGERFWGKGESVSTICLVVLLFIWIFADIPLLNLSIGLLAHFLGSIPTLIRVFKDPKSEDLSFWLFFALASLITFFSISKNEIKDYLFAVYFCLFDGGVVLLCLRKYFKSK